MIKSYRATSDTTTASFLGGGIFLYLVAGGLTYWFLSRAERR